MVDGTLSYLSTNPYRSVVRRSVLSMVEVYSAEIYSAEIMYKPTQDTLYGQNVLG